MINVAARVISPKRTGSPFDALYALLTGNAFDGGASQRKVDMSMRYVEHVLGMYCHLPVIEALPKVVDALFAYTAIDSTLRAALTGHVAGAEGNHGVSYELAHQVRERVRQSLATHLAWRRDVKGESILADLELDDMVVQFTRTVRDVFSRSLREGAAILADPQTRDDVAKRCLSVLAGD
ncbi:MAG: hypothetical protein ACAI38_04705 [Myxococcota bacterium]|nr:hypothetical protein [Myxococcota bacterium]